MPKELLWFLGLLGAAVLISNNYQSTGKPFPDPPKVNIPIPEELRQQQ